MFGRVSAVNLRMRCLAITCFAVISWTFAIIFQCLFLFGPLTTTVPNRSSREMQSCTYHRAGVLAGHGNMRGAP